MRYAAFNIVCAGSASTSNLDRRRISRRRERPKSREENNTKCPHEISQGEAE